MTSAWVVAPQNWSGETIFEHRKSKFWEHLKLWWRVFRCLFKKRIQENSVNTDTWEKNEKHWNSEYLLELATLEVKAM